MIGPLMAHVQETFDRDYTVHRYWEASDKDALVAEVAREFGRSPPTARSGPAAP